MRVSLNFASNAAFSSAVACFGLYSISVLVSIDEAVAAFSENILRMKSPSSLGLKVDGITTYSPEANEKRPVTDLLLTKLSDRALERASNTINPISKFVKVKRLKTLFVSSFASLTAVYLF